MYNILKKCLAILGVLSSLSAGAQENVAYPTNFQSSDVSSRTERKTEWFKLNSSSFGEQQVNWQSTDNLSLYMDKSSETTVYAAAGETITVKIAGNARWLNSYVYIDKDNDKQFSYTVDETNHKADPNSDLVSFSFYNFNYQASNNENDGDGYNSQGEHLINDNRNTLSLPAFKAPEKAGKYRMRVKIDWCSIDPAGQKESRFGNNMQGNGGGIIDVTLEVIQPIRFVFKTADNSDSFELNRAFKVETSGQEQSLTQKATAALGESGFYTVVSCSPETIEPNETDETNIQTVECTINSTLPFVPSKMTADNKFEDNSQKWYELYIAAANAHPTRYVDVTENDVVRTFTQVYTWDTSYMWTFVRVEDTSDRFILYNLKKGADFPLGVNSSTASASANFNDNNVIKEFQLKKVNNTAQFIMFCPGVQTSCLGHHATISEGANTGLGTWANNASTNAPGSFFTAVNVDEAVIAATRQNETNYNTDQYVGTITGERPEIFDTYTTSKTNENLTTITTALSTTNRVTTAPNKFYQIISYLDNNTKGKVIYAKPWCSTTGTNNNYGDRNLLLATNPSVAESAVKFLADGKIQHANSKYYFVELNAINDMANADLPINPNNNQTYILENRRNYSNVWSLRCANNKQKYLHSGGVAGEDNNVICRQDSPDTNDGCLWVIKEIREVPVTVGSAKWATLCLPMAVTVPDDATLSVYKVTAVDASGTLTLETITTGTVLAAETPVLLSSSSTNENDTYNFKVSYDGTTALTDNLLSGTTARRAGFYPENGTRTEYFGLANKNNTPGFYPGTSDKIAANKAYILASRVPTNVSSLNFDIRPTSICDTMMDETSPVEYYDLNGRRVLFPVHGIYVTNGGKKVFIL